VFILSGLIGYLVTSSHLVDLLQHSSIQWHAQLSISLAIYGCVSITFAHHISVIPMYAFGAIFYPTVLCLFNHQMWVGGFLIVGAGGHASLYLVSNLNSGLNLLLVKGRDTVIGHLIWVSISLGFHGFRLYLHNDTLEGLRCQEDTFHDNSIQLKPVLALMLQSSNVYITPKIEVLDTKLT
jgi:photosystem I P700 chlorophyll a apoprotein A1